MTGFKNILLPLSLTKHSKRTLERACKIALENDAPLHVLHVTTSDAVFTSLTNAEYLPERKEKERKEISELISAIPEAKKLKIDVQVRGGSPVQEIMEVLEDKTVDLVILGIHRDHEYLHFWFGSLATKLIHSTNVSVLVLQDGSR